MPMPGPPLVYILCDHSCSKYTAMTIASFMSALHFDCNRRIHVIVDRFTYKQLATSSSWLINHTIIADDIPLHYLKNQKLISRFIKTRLNTYVRPPYIFIDCDTIFKSPFNPDQDTFKPGKVYAATNHNSSLFINQCNSYEQNLLRSCGCRTFANYFNSGLLVVGTDTDKLFQLWHTWWFQILNDFGYSSDQPSLYLANLECNQVIERLPDKYNSQILVNKVKQSNIVIAHFFGSAGNDSLTLYSAEMNRLRPNEINNKIVETLVGRHFEWDINLIGPRLACILNAFPIRADWVAILINRDYLAALRSFLFCFMRMIAESLAETTIYRTTLATHAKVTK